MPDQNELLTLLNRFTKREHSLDEVYLFDLILCDNEIDRDGDCFSAAALEQLRDRFVGVTGIFDHNPRCGNQTARIFRTELCSDPGRKTKTGQVYRFLRANAYMVRTESNADLIREIDAGIKKEVSISCAVGKQICSVCGANKLRKPCSHIKGRIYSGTRCYHTLDDITDVYEWSFVAVPAQKAAGVTKTCGGACDPEKEAMQSALDAAGQLLDRLTEELRRDVVRLCYRGGENACAKALADSTVHMDADALLALRDSLRVGLAAANAPAQLMPGQAGQKPPVQAFRLAPAHRSEVPYAKS
ncbi:MAG: hypothetical protein IKQ39_02890 [Oscillospiraceae bacterium]|nr:hypothetical protein [Oscillospiraceae bacterium]